MTIWAFVFTLVAFAIGYALANRDTTNRENELRTKEANALAEYERQKEALASQKMIAEREIAGQKTELENFHSAWRKEYERLINESKELNAAFENGFIEGREWLAKAYSEYITTHDLELECALVVKSNPAWKAAEIVASLRSKRREMARELKLLQYQIASYEEYFPEILEYRDAILDEIVDMRDGGIEDLDEIDPALSLGYLTKEEYDKLTTSDKFQLALDRYWKKNKSNVEIGRIYERYIGYTYEIDGWTVHYQGALKGFEDFGRDLICTKKKSTHIVQCKCWSKNKSIREKHIMQLYGTSILYRITERRSSITPVFVTTTNLSEEANLVAKELAVEIRHHELVRYPMIKCNINPGTGERIYHLPFDQQYDRVMIGNVPEEFFANTIVEAEAAGFRRAHRWYNNGTGGT